jgi:glutaconyl-CoA/methylmalonyl-CoA decarboxylase subunit gamma
MKKYMIKLNGKVYEVEIEEVTGSTVEAATTMAKSNTQGKSNNSAQSSGGVTVEAPMPGSILGVSVKVGDYVTVDQVLVILEAMKMENEIVSPVDGKILSIGVSKGDTVNAGHVLVQIG